MEIKTVDKIMHLQESASDLDRCYPEKQESFRVTNVEYAIPESRMAQRSTQKIDPWRSEIDPKRSNSYEENYKN